MARPQSNKNRAPLRGTIVANLLLLLLGACHATFENTASPMPTPTHSPPPSSTAPQNRPPAAPQSQMKPPQNSQTAQASPNLHQQTNVVRAPLTLAEGDQIRLILTPHKELEGIYTLRERGEIILPLIGTVPAAHKTVTALQTAVHQRLTEKLYRQADIQIELVKTRPIYVLGPVARPGAVRFFPGITAASALATSGTPFPQPGTGRVELTNRNAALKSKAISGLTRLRPADTLTYILNDPPPPP